MSRTNKISKYSFFLLGLTVILTACSTRKSTFFTRAFHNTTTHYNWYFNGKEAVRSGVKKLNNRHQEDYNQIIPLYPIGSEKDAQSVGPAMDKAIKKGAKAISRHSIFIKGEEHNRWIDDCYLMIAKAYYYKREYVKAIEAFRYINRQYQGSQIDYEAAIWLARCYIDKQDYSSAELLFSTLIADEAFPENLNQPLALAYSHYHIQQKNYPSAIEELEVAISLTRKKQNKTRYLFVLAQLYHQQENYSKATHYYEQVLKKSPDYEMAFNAKINRARAFDVESGNTAKIKEELLGMLKDSKNKEYLDVIYFGLAELSMRENKVSGAIPLYRLSVAKSIENDAQKSLSSLSLGKLYYEQQNYRMAQAYYDTTVAYSDANNPEYKTALQRQTTLTSLIINLDIITNQDSLQRVATMSEQERIVYIDGIIAKIKEEERLQKERDRNNQMESMFLNDEQGRGRANDRFRQNGQQGGKWYFYNPTTLSFGFSEFNRKWGKRKLEDNWRRKNKTSLSVDEMEADTIQEEVFDPKSRDSYLKGLPLTTEEMQLSNQQIIEAYYNAGAIYKEELTDYPQSVKTFEELNSRFPINGNRVMVLYHLFRLHELLGNQAKSKNYKTQLLSEYPESEYAKIISDPSYLERALETKSAVEKLYQKAHQHYLNKEYQKVIDVCEETEINHPANLLKPNFDFLETMAQGFLEGKEKFVLRLKKIIETHQGHEVAQSAQEILRHLLFGEDEDEEEEKSETSNREEESLEVDYVFNANALHYFVIIFKDYDLDLNTAKAVFSDYHAEYYSLSRLNISSILLDEETHMISIREFGNAEKAMSYYSAFSVANSKTYFGENYTAFVIAAPNFPKFFKNKDVQGYKKKFKELYLGEE